MDSGRRPVISGVVTGPDGPVALARVSIEEAPAPMPDLAGLTGEDGTFAMGTNGAGRYVVAVHADGFVPARVVVTVGPDDDSADLRVDLVPVRTPPRSSRSS